jgi:drug/metabolite transporter (DMT)-like permease
LLVALGGWSLAGEHLKPLQLAGVATIAAGLFSTVLVSGRPRRSDRTAIAAALLTGLTIAGYSVLDGLGARRVGDPIRYAGFLFALQGLAIAAVGFASRRRDATSVRAVDLHAGIAAGTLSVAAYGIVIWAQTRAPLALVSALRETSVISAAIISALVFHEPVARRRIVPALAIAAGILVIAAASPYGPSRPARRPVEGSIRTPAAVLTRSVVNGLPAVVLQHPGEAPAGLLNDVLIEAGFPADDRPHRSGPSVPGPG